MIRLIWAEAQPSLFLKYCLGDSNATRAGPNVALKTPCRWRSGFLLLQEEKLKLREGKCLTKVTELKVTQPGVEPGALVHVLYSTPDYAFRMQPLSFAPGPPDWPYGAHSSQPSGTPPNTLHPSSLQF